MRSAPHCDWWASRSRPAGTGSCHGSRQIRPTRGRSWTGDSGGSRGIPTTSGTSRSGGDLMRLPPRAARGGHRRAAAHVDIADAGIGRQPAREGYRWPPPAICRSYSPHQGVLSGFVASTGRQLTRLLVTCREVAALLWKENYTSPSRNGYSRFPGTPCEARYRFALIDRHDPIAVKLHTLANLSFDAAWQQLIGVF
jgi:hypothetical protein